MCRWLVSMVIASSASAQVIWTNLMPFGERREHAMAYDTAKGRAVLFGGGGGRYVTTAETWEWNGASWTRRSPTVSPPGRRSAAMAYDSARRRTVLFGGLVESNGVSADTWEWDGTSWTRIAPPVSPPARMNAAMVYDAARGRVLLFGGATSPSIFVRSELADTWEWDGSSWTQLSPSQSPFRRQGHAMAYDSARGRTVLVGGEYTEYLSGFGLGWTRIPIFDTWEWDGASWTRSPGSVPRHTTSAALAYDSRRGRTVLFGGSASGVTSSDTWEWDGSSWMQRAVSVAPPPRHEHAMVYDKARGTTIVFGGEGLGDTWEWDGNAWSPRARVDFPAPRSLHGLAYDANRDRVVLFGGTDASGRRHFSDTWEWDGARWWQRSALGPSARHAHSLTHDGSRRRTVLFGGDPTNGETWDWDGNVWTQRFPSASPSARSYHATAYDVARRRVVLFGGLGPYPTTPPFGRRSLGDTWEWDGRNWLQRLPTNSPLPRHNVSMAHDAARGVTVLFGGISEHATYQSLEDTWEWDGLDWVQRFPNTRPPASWQRTLAYDAARRRVVMIQLIYPEPDLSVWEWDGVDWIERAPLRTAPTRMRSALAYDSTRARLVMFGGDNQPTALYSDTWSYAPTDPASYRSFGTGCAGTAGTPVLSAAGSLPWVGAIMQVQVSGLRPGGAAAVGFGSSSTRWGRLSLPVPLGFVGMPGCTLYTSSELLIPAANPAGTASVAVAIPASAALVGAQFHNQGFAADPGANALGLITSNGATATVGAK